MSTWAGRCSGLECSSDSLQGPRRSCWAVHERGGVGQLIPFKEDHGRWVYSLRKSLFGNKNVGGLSHVFPERGWVQGLGGQRMETEGSFHWYFPDCELRVPSVLGRGSHPTKVCVWTKWTLHP